MSESIARHYDAAKNPESASLPGVPLRDLTESEYEGYAPWLQASIDAAPFYRKTKPVAAQPKAERAADDTKEAT